MISYIDKYLIFCFVRIEKYFQVILDDPPNTLIQSEKSFFHFPDKNAAQDSWQNFLGQSEPIERTRKLRPAQ